MPVRFLNLFGAPVKFWTGARPGYWRMEFDCGCWETALGNCGAGQACGHLDIMLATVKSRATLNRTMLKALAAMAEDLWDRLPDALVLPVVMLSEARGLHILQPADVPPGLRVRTVIWADGTSNTVARRTEHEIPIPSPVMPPPGRYH